MNKIKRISDKEYIVDVISKFPNESSQMNTENMKILCTRIVENVVYYIELKFENHAKLEFSNLFDFSNNENIKKKIN